MVFAAATLTPQLERRLDSHLPGILLVRMVEVQADRPVRNMLLFRQVPSWIDYEEKTTWLKQARSTTHS